MDLKLPLAAGIALGAGILAVAACEESPAADIGLTMSAPQGILDDAKKLSLSVFPASGHTCGADGSVGDVPADAKKFQLKSSGCDSGVKWCGDVTLDQDGSEQMFFVEASGDAGVLGQGCSKAKIDQDPLEVSIKIVRFVEPSCCGDGKLQAGELCDLGGATDCSGSPADAVCQSDCTTKQIPVDFQEGGVSLGAIGQGSPSFVFAGGVGELAGGLHAVYQTDSTGNSDVGVRFFKSDLSPITSPASLAAPHRLMIRCTGSDVKLARQQKTPGIVAFGADSALVAFRSNTVDVLRDDAYVAIVSGNGCNEATDPTLVSDGLAGVDAIDVAVGPAGSALVVYQEDGAILGVTYASGTGASAPFTIAAAGSEPRVAGGSSGWVVVYRGSSAGDDDGILMSRVSSTQTVSAPVLVNTATSGAQDQPDVASLSDGRAAIVWRSGGNVLAQRFGADDAPTDGDQAAPISTAGGATSPRVEGDSGTGYFAVAWAAGSEIRARYLGATSGFLFNPSSG
ncbi:MAG TPA: hypothetical protein VL400_24735, partial [Polyangiaceae bacterium]|nr:hypothetical protein [Polyangiaceae bacterium]